MKYNTKLTIKTQQPPSITGMNIMTNNNLSIIFMIIIFLLYLSPNLRQNQMARLHSNDQASRHYTQRMIACRDTYHRLRFWLVVALAHYKSHRDIFFLPSLH